MALAMRLALSIAAVCVAHGARRQKRSSADMVLPPANKALTPAALVFVPGAATANTAYKPMLVKLQERAAEKGVSLYAGAIWYLGDSPNPVDLKFRCSSLVNNLKAAGLPATAPVFYGGHSLGSVFVQDLVKDLGPTAAKGQILMGGSLRRGKLFPSFNYSVSTLTLGGELDGLSRITRITENFYHQKGKADMPVVILMGLNHHNFASGTPSSHVAKWDLKSEVTEAVAHDEIAKVGADYIANRIGKSDGSVLRAAVTRSATFFAPIVEAYEFEGSRHFNMPAQYGGPAENLCEKGRCPMDSFSRWAMEGQRTISSVGAPLRMTNRYVMAGGSPTTGQYYNLPNVTNENGTLFIPTFSEGYWASGWDDIQDKMDTGMTFTAASEIAGKLWSRQCTMNVGLGMNVSFSVDDPEFCAQTNKKAYDWALSKLPAVSKTRFTNKGIKMTWGPDLPRNTGPTWLFDRIRYEMVNGSVRVSSPMQKTQQTYWVDTFGPIPRPPGLPDPGCYHYCKMMSPAYAMEWMLVDSLRR